MGDHPLLSGLDERQRQAVITPVSPLSILAGAGSGKTRVLTRRIAYQASLGRIDAAHTLALTFTRKAAGELSERLAVLGLRRSGVRAGPATAVTAGTFHAVALAQLRRRWADRGEALPALLERKVRLLVPFLPPGPSVGTEAAEVAGEIEWAKARLLTPEDYEAAVAAAGRATPRPPAEVAGLYERYETEKRHRGVVDFDDLIWGLAEALENDAAFAAATRWRFRHLFVDEFQDVNPAQFRLLRAWLGDPGSRGVPDKPADLCVVGDEDQAIYGFTGADASYLVGFATHFAGAAVVRLEANFRSSPQVLAVAHAVLPAGKRSRQPLRPTLAAGPLPEVVAYATDAEEAAGVARALRSAHGPGVAWASMAVLYRTNAQSARLEAALAAAGIPHRVRGAARFLERPEVVSALAELRRASATAPGVGLAHHLRGLELWADDAPDERRAHVAELVRLGGEYLAGEDGPGTLSGFLAHLTAALADGDSPTDGDAVELLTFHRAKGLEWPRVFVTGVERGLVPIAYAETAAARAEERRLLYVALTRAERHLVLSWAAERTLGARAMTRHKSPYLAEVEAALGALAAGGDGDWRSAVAAERARLASRRPAAGRGRLPGADADPLVLADLVEWRRGLARASGVPAQVIFHDTTLALVAEARPATRDDLLSLPGFGPVLVERYGAELLALLARHAS
jgi:DNA helicase-2/ATP-dependent DNA helicase PcrA